MNCGDVHGSTHGTIIIYRTVRFRMIRCLYSHRNCFNNIIVITGLERYGCNNNNRHSLRIINLLYI